MATCIYAGWDRATMRAVALLRLAGEISAAELRGYVSAMKAGRMSAKTAAELRKRVADKRSALRGKDSSELFQCLVESYKFRAEVSKEWARVVAYQQSAS